MTQVEFASRPEDLRDAPRDWTELKPDIFPRGSLGIAIFPHQLLTGRYRPITAYDVKLNTLISHNSAEKFYVDQFGLTTCREALSQPQDNFNNLPYVRSKLEMFFNGLAVTPQAGLIGAVLRTPQAPVASGDEGQLIYRVNKVVNALREGFTDIKPVLERKELFWKILVLQYGLVTGVPLSATQLQSILNMDITTIQSNSRFGVNLLRKIGEHPDYDLSRWNRPTG